VTEKNIHLARGKGNDPDRKKGLGEKGEKAAYCFKI
jgi:hypothetical protein